jgi:hypothetical protein
VQCDLARDRRALPSPSVEQRFAIQVDEVDLTKVRGQRLELEVVAVAGAEHGERLASRFESGEGHALAMIAKEVPPVG